MRRRKRRPRKNFKFLCGFLSASFDATFYFAHVTGHTVERLERVRLGAFLPRISGFSKRNVRMSHKKDFVVELDLGWSLFPKTAVIYDSRRVF